MIRANIWSGPRNVSTALMYSFRQHHDVTVVDEPFYGHWLRASGADHPGREETLKSMELDAEAVIATLEGEDWETPALVCKQMANHVRDLRLDWIDGFVNILLVRDPREVLLSYSKGVEHPDLDMLGYPTLLRLLERDLEAGRVPIVVESRTLLEDPEAGLARMCDAMGLSFDPVMLTWPAGPKPEDGAWAPHWYAGVHRSTGFAPHRPRAGELPTRLQQIEREARPLWEELLAHA